MSKLDVEDLIARHYDAALSSEERAQLDQAIIDDAEVAALFVRYADLHAQLKGYAKDQAAGPAEIIEFPQDKKTHTADSRSKIWGSIAAALLLILLGSTWFGEAVDEQGPRLEIVRGSVQINGQNISGSGCALEPGQDIQTALDAAATLILADASRIHLDSNSLLRYVTNQRIELEDASIRCEITKRTELERLTIHSAEATIEVVGTAFSVINRDGTAQIMVEHGTVAVQTRHQAQPVYLMASDHLRVSEHYMVSSVPREEATHKTLWQINFENGQLEADCKIGAILANPLMPLGNDSLFCAVAERKDDGVSLLQFVLKSDKKTYFVVEEDAYISFRYWATESCGWLGVWLASPPAHHYLHYHREFVPIANKWVTARIRLSDCMRGDSPAATESIPLGAPVYWFMLQSGNLPGAKFLIDDIRVEVPVR